ncbi:MAG TPA: hypothetical protein VNF45_06810 [Candidatus Binataceae bacterium]|nr:hypothetical protein [Candidatus Binataceae bacterium]
METESQSMFFEAETPQASRELEELRRSADYVPPFAVIRRRVIDDYNDGRMTIDATVLIRVGGVEEFEAASGVGALHSLDLVLRKILLKHFPFLDPVRVLETYTHATSASTEADVMSVNKFSDGRLNWVTLVKSANTIEAGWQSLVDGYEWRINYENAKLRRMAANPRIPRR